MGFLHSAVRVRLPPQPRRGVLAPATSRAEEANVALRPAPSQKLLPRFPDFGQFPPPAKYQGRIFKLSQDYPTRKPAIEPAVRKILSIDFTKDWKAYAEAVRDYIYEGNIEADGVANDFYLEDNKVRRWYHVPWQHWGPFGREGISLGGSDQHAVVYCCIGLYGLNAGPTKHVIDVNAPIEAKRPSSMKLRNTKGIPSAASVALASLT